MLPVSVQWQNAIRQQFRYQAYLRCRIKVVPPGLMEGLQTSTTDTEVCSDIESMFHSYNTNSVSYISCEQNRWLLNGNFQALSSGEKVDDWWSTVSEGTKVIHFVFDKAYSVPGIVAMWDISNGTYPRSIRIKGYNVSGEQTYDYAVTDVSSESGFVDAAMDDVKSVDLEIPQWDFAGWRSRIFDIFFGLSAQYDSVNNGRVLSATIYDKSSPLSDSLPKHTIKTNLRNLDREFDPTLERGIAKYLDRKQLAQYQIGFSTYVDSVTGRSTVEWTPWLPYWVDSFKIPTDSKDVSIEVTSRLAYLTSEFSKDEYDATDRTLYDVAQKVLSNCDVVRIDASETPWKLSDKLKNFTTSAPIPKEAVNAVLQLIANAGTCWLHSNTLTDWITIEDFDETEVLQNIDETSTLGDPQIEIVKQLYSVSVGLYKYVVADEATEISKGTYVLSNRATIQIEYNVSCATEITCTVSGAVQVSFTPYSASAVLVVDASTEGASVEVIVKGKEVKSSVTYIETFKDAVNTQGEVIRVENPFITNSATAQAVSDCIVKWYNKKQVYTAPYLGYPELEAGDAVSMSTTYGSGNVTVLGNKIDFNGAFTGTLEAR